MLYIIIIALTVLLYCSNPTSVLRPIVYIALVMLLYSSINLMPMDKNKNSLMEKIGECQKVPNLRVITVCREYLSRWSVSDQCYNSSELNDDLISTVNNIRLLLEEFGKAHINIQEVGINYDCLGKLREEIQDNSRLIVQNYMEVVKNMMSQDQSNTETLDNAEDLLSELTKFYSEHLE